MPTSAAAELPPKYTLARPPLLASENAAAAAANANTSTNNNDDSNSNSSSSSSSSSSPVTATTASGASFYLSPRAVSALESLEQRAREPGVLYGRDVIQVPLRLSEEGGAYVNLVLSHREFDRMAVHIPQYDEMAPRALLDEITRLLQEEERAQQRKQSLAGGVGATSSDSAAAFQARVMELEFERKRLTTKLQAARALQTSVTDENTALRMNVRELEATTLELEKLRLQNELLREQAVRAASEVARMQKRAGDAQRCVRQVASELEQLRTQVGAEREALNRAAAELMTRVTTDVQRREQLLQSSYLEEKSERQRLAEKYYELSGRIRVFCRVRPPAVRGDATALVRPKPNSVLVGAKEFAFDHVFGPEATQSDVYAQVAPLVMSFADGYNACIMAYGQTGTGKTFTMMGDRHNDAESEGVIPRALQHVFAAVDARQLSYIDSLSVSMVEIYNDQVLDLLNEDASRAGKGAAVKNESDISARSVSHWAHVDAVLAEGNANRNIAATSMNLESSRSHALVYLYLESQHRETLETKRSTLCLVDLAGSERISRSQVEGERLRETQHINKSLSALGDVVYALQHKAKHTPYRNSKLTYMLRDMLSGQAKTLLLLQLSPDEPDVEETTCSLQFGARVSQVQMGAVRPSVESGELFRLKDETRSLESRLRASEEKLAEWKDECRYKSEQLTEARERTKDLERQLRVQSNEVASFYENDAPTTFSSEVGSPPASPSGGYHLRTAPSSPTQSVKSTRSTTSSASLPAPSSSSSVSRLAARRSLGASMRQPPPANDTMLDKETRRKSLSTLPTRSSPPTLSTRSIRATREAPSSLPSRKPLTSSSSTTTSSSVPQSPAATSRIARPRTSLGASSSSTPTTGGASGTPRAPLRRTSSLASSAGPASSTGTPRAAASRAELRRPLSRSSSGVRPAGTTSTTTGTMSRPMSAAPSFRK